MMMSAFFGSAYCAYGSFFGAVAAAAIEEFSDDFNRANENLEANANWTRLGGNAGWGTVSNNAVAAATTNSTGAAFFAPDLGTADIYVQAKWMLEAGGAASFLCARMTNASNFIGARWNTTENNVELYKRVSSTFTQLAETAFVLLDGDTVRLEVDGDSARVLVNGVPVILATALAGVHAGVTGYGLVCRSIAVDPWIDNFEAGAL